jgi:hypothetical protein
MGAANDAAAIFAQSEALDQALSPARLERRNPLERGDGRTAVRERLPRGRKSADVAPAFARKGPKDFPQIPFE